MMKRTFPKTFDILVGNLPLDIQKENLERLFGNVAKIESLSILPDKKNEDGKLAYVRYAKEMDAEKMVKECKQMSVAGRTLFVKRGNYARERGSGDHKMSHEEDPEDGMPSERRSSVSIKESNHQPMPQSAMVSYSNTVEIKGRNMAEVIKELKIMPTHVIGPTSFWGHHLEDSMLNNLFELSQKLQIICPSSNAVAGSPPMNKVYATNFSADNQWYRCKVVRHIGDNKCEVIYLDYGNGEIKENKEIVELPCNLSTPEPFAQKFSLFGLISVDDPDSMGYLQGQQQLANLISDKMLTAKVCRGPASGDEVNVMLQDKDVDINQEMLDKGFAKRKLNQQQKQLEVNVKRAEQQPKNVVGNFETQRQVAHNSNPGQFKMSRTFMAEASMTRDSNKNIHASFRSDTKWSGLKFPLSSDNNGAGDGLNSESETELRNLKTEVLQLRERLGQSEQERQELMLQIRGEQNKFQTVCESYKQMSFRLLETDMSNKIKCLIDGVKHLRLLRHQFPTDDELCRDNVDHAIALLTNKQDNNDLVNPTITKKVHQTMKEYRLAQDNVKLCVDQAEFQTLIESRDELRKSVFDSLVEFHDATSEINIEERIDKTQDALDSLLNTHASFLECESEEISGLEEVTNMYRDWKDRYLIEFKDIRTLTNTRHNAVDSSIQLLQQQLSLDIHGSTQNPSAIPAVSNLEILFTKFLEMIRIEIAKTDMFANKDSMPILGSIAKFLVNMLKAELDDLREFQTQIAEFHVEMKQIEPWLNDKPDALIVKLQSLRKVIRMVKSKLRHKIVDLCDIEENDGEANSDFFAVKKEITSLRTELQTAYLEEDNSLQQIPELCEKHFPELQSQYPDLCLNTYMKHNGLVKFGWSLDHYDLDNPSDTKKRTLLTTFCGKSVVLKEYLVGDSFGISREDFTDKVAAYNRLNNPHLLKLGAVFFEQNKSRAFIQMPFCERSLTSVVKSGPVSLEWSLKVLGDVLSGLHALFDANIAHGAVHPDNVFINANGRAFLAECDFTKPTLKANERTFTSNNGLRFAPPEPFVNHVDSMKARDMYNFGILALWIHFPQELIPVQNNGLPDTSALQLGEPLNVILRYLVVQDPKERKTIEYLMKLPFFNNPFKAPSRENAESETLQLRCNFSPRSGSPTGKINGGILKRSPKNGSYLALQQQDDALLDRNRDSPPSGEADTRNPSSMFQEVVKVFEQNPQLASQINHFGNEVGELNGLNMQKTDFSPIVNSLPCTPMGTPGNTPTEISANSKETCGNSPRQNIIKTLQKVAELVLLDGDQNLASIAEDEMARENEVDGVESDGTITEEDCDELESLEIVSETNV